MSRQNAQVYIFLVIWGLSVAPNCHKCHVDFPCHRSNSLELFGQEEKQYFCHEQRANNREDQTENTFSLKSHDVLKGCPEISVCAYNRSLKQVNLFWMETEQRQLETLLQSQCKKDEYCCSMLQNDEYWPRKSQNEFFVNTTDIIEIETPECSTIISRDYNNELNIVFTCSWPATYFKVNATLTLQGEGSLYSYHSCDSYSASNLSAKQYLQSMFENNLKTKVDCMINEYTTKLTQSCRFPLYLKTRKIYMYVGKSQLISCPRAEERVYWWGIRKNEMKIFRLNVSKIASDTAKALYTPTTFDKDGLIVICGFKVTEISVFGIAKVKVIGEPRDDESSLTEITTKKRNYMRYSTTANISYVNPSKNNVGIAVLASGLICSLATCICLVSYRAFSKRMVRSRTLRLQNPMQAPSGYSYTVSHETSNSIQLQIARDRQMSDPLPGHNEPDLNENGRNLSLVLGACGQPLLKAHGQRNEEKEKLDKDESRHISSEELFSPVSSDHIYSTVDDVTHAIGEKPVATSHLPERVPEHYSSLESAYCNNRNEPSFNEDINTACHGTPKLPDVLSPHLQLIAEKNDTHDSSPEEFIDQASGGECFLESREIDTDVTPI